MTLQRHYRQRCIALTVRRFNTRFVGRAFAVAPFANLNTPAALPPTSCGQRGEGPLTVQTVGGPAFDHSFHANPISTGAQHDHA